MAALTKRQRKVAQSAIDLIADPHMALGMTLDEYNRVLDSAPVRDFCREACERRIFLAGLHAANKLERCLRDPAPGQKRLFLTSPEQKLCELALKLGGMTGKTPIKDKGSTGVDDFIDPVPVPN